MSVNKVILIGNVGQNPRIDYVQGCPVATLSLATNEPAPAPAEGAPAPQPRTEWHSLVLWGPQAEVAERYIRKGTKLYVEGKLRYRIWQDRNTISRKVTEIYVDTFEILG